MFVIIDEHEIGTSQYTSRFGIEGVASAEFRPEEFRLWVTHVADADLGAVEAFLLGEIKDRQIYPKLIRERSGAPLIAMNEVLSLGQTLDLFAAGVDDVVRTPIHVREILARVAAIKRRHEENQEAALVGDMWVFFDGRDPEIKGEALSLPRRERRILEYLVNNRGRRVSKAQIFNSVYGIFDENVEENVVERHISSLRKKLRSKLGYDPINSVRYLGYRFEDSAGGNSAEVSKASQLVEKVSDLFTENVVPNRTTFPSLPKFDLAYSSNQILETALYSLKKTSVNLADAAEARTKTVAQLASQRSKIDRTQSEMRILLEALVESG